MKFKGKNIRITILSVVIALAAVSFFLHNHFAPIYPSLKQQRAALLNKQPADSYRELDSATIIADLKFLSSAACQGRKAGTPGHDSAVTRIIQRFRDARLDSLFPAYTQYNDNRLFPIKNIIGVAKGKLYPKKYIAITAHYDHLGVNSRGEIFYGASDNASGTACLLSMAGYFVRHPIDYSVLFIAFDGEEKGLKGSKYFLTHLPEGISSESIKLNINIDMITRGKNEELFACGISHFPSLLYLVTETQNRTNAKILMGHDTGGNYDDWTDKSDHYSFYNQKIPFIYFGTEDHPDLHKPGDTFDKINLSSYIENCNYCLMVARSIKLE